MAETRNARYIVLEDKLRTLSSTFLIGDRLLNYLSPRPSHRDRVPHFVYLLDRSSADYLAGKIPFGVLAGDIEGFAESVWNCFGGRFSWESALEDLYWMASIPYFAEETFSNEQLESIHQAIAHLRAELAAWWADNTP